MLEVCCFNAESAVVAADAGADRIELCADREAGGTTPPIEWLLSVRQKMSRWVPIFVMIRPRGGDFYYSDAELDTMLADIGRFKPHADGFVFGLLDRHGDVDVANTTALVKRAHPLPCTFHRAIDAARDLQSALHDIVSTGCRSILSSGGAETACLGATKLKGLVGMAGDRITIMPGGGVRASNIRELQEAIGAKVFHSSAAVPGSELPAMEEIRQLKKHITLR